MSRQLIVRPTVRRSDLLFGYDVNDHPEYGLWTCATGHIFTPTGASISTVKDYLGAVKKLVSDEPAFDFVDTDGDGIRDALARTIEAAATNLCLRSENFGATWAAVGTPTRTAAAKICGDLVLDLIGDDDGAALEGYTQTITFTGTGVAKAISFFWAPSTSAGTVIRLRDTTAAADRLLCRITGAIIPTVTMTTGTQIGSAEACGNGVYRITVQTTAVTTANVNSLQVYPATDAALAVASQGKVYLGGIQAENRLFSTSYIPTVAGTVTRATSPLVVTGGVAFLAQSCTLRIRMPRPLWAGLAGDLGQKFGIWSWSATNPRLEVYFDQTTRFIFALIHDGTTSQTASVAIPAGNVLDFAVQFNNLDTAATCRIDPGTGVFGAASTAVGAIAAMGGTGMCVGDLLLTPGQCLEGAIQSVRLGDAGLTLAQIQARR